MKLILTIVAAMLIFAGKSYACLTAELIEKLSRLGDANAGILEGRPQNQYNWITPDGRFRIHYDLIGENAVYHSGEDFNPVDGIPDYVNRTADYLSLAYDSLIIGIGFDPPPSDGGEGGDSRYDVYLTQVPGLTTPENPSLQYPGRPAYTSFMQLGHDLRNQRYPDDPYPYLMAMASHEFSHAIQFAYRAYSSDYTAWWFESCANWAEEKVFDDVNDVYFYLPFYLSYPERSLYKTGSIIYGAWLLPEFLDERYDPQLLVECWEKFSGFDFSVTAIDYALHERGNELSYEYCLHAAWNYFTGPNYLDGFYQEGAWFNTTVGVAMTHYEYPIDWSAGPLPLENMASSYIEFRRADFGKNNLVIEYYNSTDDRHMVALSIVNGDGSVQLTIHEIDNGIPSRFIIEDFVRTKKVIMTPVWLFERNSENEFTNYMYHAYLDSLTSVEDSNPQPIANYYLIGAYPNPFNGAVSLSFDTPAGEPYSFSVYDIAGRKLSNNFGSSVGGHNIINWTPPNDLASGVLFYVINFHNRSLSGKMSLLK